MATNAAAIKAVRKKVSPGISEGTVTNTARALQPVYFPVATVKGGGKNAVHVTNEHMANLLLGLAASGPIEAPETVRVLRQLRFAEQEITNIRSPAEGDTLGHIEGLVSDFRQSSKPPLVEYLAYLIDEASDPDRKAIAARRKGTEIILCPEPAFAEIVWHGPDSVWRSKFQGPDDDLAPASKRPRTRRQTIITYDLIELAGELWGDTRRRLVESNSSEPLSLADIPAAKTKNARAAIPTAARASFGNPQGGGIR